MAHLTPRNGSVMHALIENNVITALRVAPAGGAWEDGQWLDFTDPTILAEWEERHGWTPVTLTPRPVDTETIKHDEAVVLVDGVPTQTWMPRDLTAEEIEAANASTVSLALAEGMVADKALVEAAITALATLLANSTTAGSYRSVLGLGTDPAGLASLRAWRSQTNAAVVTAASLKGLAALLIQLVQLDIAQARETRRLARQVLRLSRVQTGDLTSADVGDDVG